MIRWLQFLFQICLLKATPQEAPSSKLTQYVATFAYWALGVVLIMFGQGYGGAALLATVQTAIFFFLTYLVLWIRNYPQRIPQTVTALMGSGAMISLIAVPVIILLGDANIQSVQPYLFVAGVLLLWQGVVIGHILRHALEVPFIAGFGIALLFTYMSFAVTFRFLRILGFQVGT